MADEVVIRFSADGRGAQSVIRQLIASLKTLEQQGAKSGAGAKGLGSALQGAQGPMSGLLGMALKLGGGFAAGFLSVQAIGGALRRALDAMQGLVDKGIQFNQFMETSRIGIAAILTAQSKITDQTGKTLEGMEKFSAASTIAADQVNKIRIAGLKTSATTQDLVAGFQTLLAPAQAMGLSLDQTREITVKITQAMGALGIPLREIGQEARGLLNGEISRNNRLNQILRVSKEELATAKAQGKVYDLLNDKLKGFALAGDQVATSFQGIFSNVEEGVSTFAGIITQGLFERMKDAGLKIQNALFDSVNAKLQPAIQGLADSLSDVLDGLGDLANDTLDALIHGAQDFSGWLSKHRADVKVIADNFFLILRTVGALIGDLIHIGAESGKIGAQAGVIADWLGIIVLNVAVLRSAVRLVGVAFQAVAAIIVDAILFPLGEVLDLLGKGGKILGLDWGEGLEDVGKKLKRLGVVLAKDVLGNAKDVLDPIAEAAHRIDKIREDANKPRPKDTGTTTDVSGFTITSGDQDDPDKKGRAARAKGRAEELRELEQYYKDRRDLQLNFLRLTGREDEAALQEALERLKSFTARATALGDLTGTALAVGVFNVERLKIAGDAFARQVDGIQKTLQDRLHEVQVRQEAGLLSGGDARKQVKALYADAVAGLEAQLAALEKLNAEAKSPALAEAIRQAKVQIIELQNEAKKSNGIFADMGQQLAGAISSGINQNLDDWTRGVKDFGEAFAAMTKDVLRNIADTIRQMLVQYAVQQLLKAAGFAALAEGGPVRMAQGGPFPRFALGGVNDVRGGGYVRGAGTTKSDSILARLSNREYVLRAEATALYGEDFLNRLNALQIRPRDLQGFAMGGLISAGAVVPRRETEPAGRRDELALTVDLADDLVLRALHRKHAGRDFTLDVLRRNKHAVRAILS